MREVRQLNQRLEEMSDQKSVHLWTYGILPLGLKGSKGPFDFGFLGVFIVTGRNDAVSGLNNLSRLGVVWG